MGLKWLVFLIGPIDLIDMWFGEDQIANVIKTQCLKEIGLHLQILITTLHSIVPHNWEHLCIQLRNQQTCTSNNHN